MDADKADEILADLPAELRQVDLAAVLGVSLGHVEKMRGLNRVPKPDYRVVWLRESISGWLRERLINRDADLAAAHARHAGANGLIGHPPRNAKRAPLWPFLGIF